jgi:hypothetical protein
MTDDREARIPAVRPAGDAFLAPPKQLAAARAGRYPETLDEAVAALAVKLHAWGPIPTTNEIRTHAQSLGVDPIDLVEPTRLPVQHRDARNRRRLPGHSAFRTPHLLRTADLE